MTKMLFTEMMLSKMIAPVYLLLGISIIMGVFGEVVFSFCQEISAELMNPDNYVEAVLGSIQL